jgi:hypothetical protein
VLSGRLFIWEHTTFGQVRHELWKLNKKLKEMQSDPGWLGPS